MDSNGILIRNASNADLDIVSSVLCEAAQWLISRGDPLWNLEDISSESIANDVLQGTYWLALQGGEPAGCVRLQMADSIHWPDAPSSDAAYIHKLAVRRKFSGGGVSDALIDWAKQRTRQIGRRVLRLDCDARRPKLAELYSRNGFSKHSEFQAGPHRIARFECELL